VSLLLFLTSALLAVSGATKLRSASRAGLGVPVLALAEMVWALALALAALPGASTPATSRWGIPIGVTLVLVSSARYTLRLRAERRRRADSEGGRLATYVKFLSRSDDLGGAGP
jgi:hypothetical protein